MFWCIPLSARFRCEPWQLLSVFPRQQPHSARPAVWPPPPPSVLAPSPAWVPSAPPAISAALPSAPLSEPSAVSLCPPVPWPASRLKKKRRGKSKVIMCLFFVSFITFWKKYLKLFTCFSLPLLYFFLGLFPVSWVKSSFWWPLSHLAGVWSALTPISPEEPEKHSQSDGIIQFLLPWAVCVWQSDLVLADCLLLLLLQLFFIFLMCQIFLLLLSHQTVILLHQARAVLGHGRQLTLPVRVCIDTGFFSRAVCLHCLHLLQHVLEKKQRREESTWFQNEGIGTAFEGQILTAEVR